MRTPFCLSLALLIAACGEPPDAGQSGEENIGCLPVADAPYGLTDETPLGFTGQDVVDAVVGEHAATLTWARGGDTPLEVAVTTTATGVLWRDREWADDGGGMEMIYTECEDDLVLEVTVGFTTEDGAFAESWPMELSAVEATGATAFVELDLDALAGTYEVTEVDPADFDDVRAFLDLTVGAEGASGIVDGQGESVDGEVASAQAFGIASFE